jgi:hypothetical protein
LKIFTALTVVVAMIACTRGYSQNSVVIGTMVNKPNAVLVLNPPGANQGFLLPQLTTSSRLTIKPSSSEDGLIVFDITDKEFYHWKNNAWVKGLGTDATQSLSFDSQTLRLSISNGNQIDLSQLKEVPSLAGHAGKFMTTDGTTLSWASLGAIGDITSIVNGKGLTGGVTSGDATLAVSVDNSTINFNATDQLQLANNAVSTAKIADGAVTTNKISDNTVSSTKIIDNAVNTNKIADGSVTSTKLANTTVTPGTYGTATSVSQLTVDAKGRITSAVNVPITGITAAGNATGDLTGTYPAPKVAKLQGNSVSATVLGAVDNGKVMVWSGTQWNAQTVSSLTPTLQFYNLDPSDFRSIREAGKKDHDNGLIFQDNNTFITVHKKDEGEFLIAPLHLPDGAAIQQVLFYYMDRDVKNLNVTVYRKTFTGNNEDVVSTWTSTGSSGAIQSTTLSPIPARAVVDNALYTYRLVVQLDVTEDSNDSIDADHRVYGVQVKYIK